MDITRRDIFQMGGKLLILAIAGATLEQITGAEEPPEAYRMADHWWGMIIDIDRCICCGNCVRACSNENGVPKGYYRTWVERYEVQEQNKNPRVDSRDGAINGFPPSQPPPPKASSCPSFATTARIRRACRFARWAPRLSARMGWSWSIRPTVSAAATCVQACPYGCRYLHPDTETVDKCTLCYHRITKGLTTACCENCPTGARQLADFKNPKDPVHEFLRANKVTVLKPQMATEAKVYYKDLDGSVR
jgi:Fe-S-cluster-containing dehydrogenase component